MLDSTAAVATERQRRNARQLREAGALETGDAGIAISVLTVLEHAHGITRADTAERRERLIWSIALNGQKSKRIQLCQDHFSQSMSSPGGGKIAGKLGSSTRTGRSWWIPFLIVRCGLEKD